MKEPCTYILANERNGTLYVGVTSDLHGRMSEHRQGLLEGFTKRYGVTRLVYHEHHLSMDEAIEREKRLKKWRRDWKVRLIEQANPDWIDLYDERSGAIIDGPADAQRHRS